MSQSRRDFIKTVILSTGAVFVSWNDVFSSVPTSKNASIRTSSLHFAKAHELLHDGKAMPQFPYHAVNTETVIIGGGTAGMAAAWKLKKAGREFLLLENEPVIGGVMHNPVPHWQSIPYSLGSTYFYRYNDVYREFYNDIGVRPIETGEDALYFGNNEIIVDWWNPRNINSLPISTTDKDAFKKFRDTLLAIPIPSYPLSSASKDMMHQYDSISGYEFVNRFGSDVLSNLLDMYSRSVLGGSLKQINAYSLLNFYSLEFGDAYQIPCYTFPGGLGEIAQKTFSYLGTDQIRLNALVLNVENTSDKVAIVHYIDTVTGESHSVKAKNVIIATQKQIAKHIVKDLPSEQHKAMDQIHYAPYITIALCCNEQMFSKRAFDFWINDNEKRFTDIIDVSSSDAANGNPDHKTGKFIYMLSSCRPENERMNLQDEKWLVEFAQKAANAVNEHVPGALGKIEEMHVFAWGHSMVIPTVGSHENIYPIHAQSCGNIHFANSDNDLAPGIENAMEWGFETAGRCI
jgi:protoporphyrinogen oxidase